MAALLGAHIIKVKLPTAHLEQAAAAEEYVQNQVDISTLQARVRHVVEACFQGRRLVVFFWRGGENSRCTLQSSHGCPSGGGNGLLDVIGRNAFRRPLPQSLNLLHNLIKFIDHRQHET